MNDDAIYEIKVHSLNNVSGEYIKDQGWIILVDPTDFSLRLRKAPPYSMDYHPDNYERFRFTEEEIIYLKLLGI
jgi:hypothetical protein